MKAKRVEYKVAKMRGRDILRANLNDTRTATPRVRKQNAEIEIMREDNEATGSRPLHNLTV